jgi:hypothetical protein
MTNFSCSWCRMPWSCRGARGGAPLFVDSDKLKLRAVCVDN